MPPDTPPPPRRPGLDQNDWTPFENRTEFEAAEFLYCRTQMSGTSIDVLMDLWAASLLKHNDVPPFANHSDLYNIIDAIPLGDIPWQHLSVRYQGVRPDGVVPPWMDDEYEVWFRDPRTIVRQMLANPDYDGHIDYSPVQNFDSNGDREYHHFMSGDWAWEQAVSFYYYFQFVVLTFDNLKDTIAEDKSTHGSMFVPIILGSDKTTVSVATGQNEFYPVYASIGVVHNDIRRAHRGAVVLIGFLAIPKSTFFFSIEEKTTANSKD